MGAFSTPTPPSPARTLGEPRSELTKRLIREGLTAPKRAKLTDAQALVERLEGAARPGVGTAERRRMLLEAAVFVRETIGATTVRAA